MAKTHPLVRLILATCLVWLGACQSAGAPAGLSASEAAAPILQAAEYRLGPGDQLRISVFGQADLTGAFVVSANGIVAYPLLGEVVAAGATIPQFSKLISEKLQAGYVLHPKVSIEVSAYRPFYILGEVGRPGTYPFSAGLTVMNAVATAGGFSYRANSQVVFVKHADELTEQRYALTSTTPVQPGDTVRIPERTF